MRILYLPKSRSTCSFVLLEHRPLLRPLASVLSIRVLAKQRVQTYRGIL